MARIILAITIQTLKAAVRQRVFHVLLFLVFLAVTLLPLTVAGDGTAAGQVQITLTYTFGILTALISAAAIWIACSGLSREIEGYQMHLVLTTSAPRWAVWMGKWLGVFLLHAFIFCLGAAIIYGLLFWQLNHWKFPADQITQVRREVLVGRQEYQPERPDFAQLVDREYQQRIAQLDPNHNPKTVRSELLRQIKARSTETPFEATRFWRYTGISAETPDTLLYLRYRHYAGSTSRSDQKFTEGIWGVKVPGKKEDFVWLPQRAMSGTFHEVTIPAKYVDETGALILNYTNLDSEQNAVIFQLADGPSLLVPATGFLANYLRASFLVLLQLAFLVALGTAVGAVFSTPVALFTAGAYLVIGLTVQSAISVPNKDEVGAFQYKDLTERVAHYVALGTGAVVVSINDFDASMNLSGGRLISGQRLLLSMGTLILLRTLPLALLGMWVLTRRELGTVVRG